VVTNTEAVSAAAWLRWGSDAEEEQAERALACLLRLVSVPDWCAALWQGEDASARLWARVEHGV